MLELKKDSLDDLLLDDLIGRATKLGLIEYEAEMDVPLYLITWCPDPKEMPNTDFYLQHNVNVDTLASFLKSCKRGVFCVETTQLGNPHYHGWYQVSDDYRTEQMRIAIIKTMNRFGMVKISQARSWKPYCWTEAKNALYYYKKDLNGNMAFTYPNPIFSDTVSTVNWDVLEMAGFFDHRNKVDVSLKDKISDRKFYRQFYLDTISTLN